MADLLRTDYKDDILDADKNTSRKYNMITNEDGTVSFEDKTDYTQTGDSFGSADVNRMNNAINDLSKGSGVELTLAEYKALGDKVNSDNVTYFIKDDSEPTETLNNMRYNPENDTVEIYYNGAWVAWRNASMQELKALIPIMSANSQSGYTVSIGGTLKSAAYLAFDGNTSTRAQFYKTADGNFDVNITFPKAVCARKLYLNLLCNRMSSCIVSASNDGSVYDTLASFDLSSTFGTTYEVDFDNNHDYTKYRLIFGKAPYLENEYHLIPYTIQLYGRE